MSNRPIEWYKWGYFWRRGDADEDEGPLDRGDGTGDVIFNTLTKIVVDQDTSTWAYTAFFSCVYLLENRKRWPDEMNTGYEARNMVGYWIRKVWRMVFGSHKPLYKPQSRMSRDPFIAAGACYWHLKENCENLNIQLNIFFRNLEIPLHLCYAMTTCRWFRRLKVDGRKFYVKQLDYFKAKAVVNKFEKLYGNDFYNDR